MLLSRTEPEKPDEALPAKNKMRNQTQKQRPVLRTIFNILLVLALLFAAGQAVVHAQSDETGGIPGADLGASDLARLVGYGLVNSTVDENGTAQFEWETTYEVGIVGFNIWAESDDGLIKLNEQLIPADGLGSPDIQRYTYSAVTNASAFYLEHVTVENELAQSPRFPIGEQIGQAAGRTPTNWATIRTEHDALVETQRTADAARVNRELDAIRTAPPAADEPLLEQTAGTLDAVSIYLPLIVDEGDGTQRLEAEAANLAPGTRIELHVDQDGIYRVTHADFLAAGFDLTGVPSAHLALTNLGEPLRMRVVAPPTSWGPVDAGEPFIEFVGEAIDTLYTGTNVYLLEVDPAKALRVFTDRRVPDMTKPVPDYYMETARFEENLRYASGATGPDPWYWSLVQTQGDLVSEDYPLVGIDQVARGASQATLDVDIFSYSRGNHHVTIGMNGSTLASEGGTFSGALPVTISGQFDSALLANGANTFTWTLPGDATDDVEVVGLESVTITYPRRFVARDGAIAFVGDAQRYDVSGFESDELVAYSLYRNRLWRMEGLQIVNTGGTHNSYFSGWDADATYFLSELDAVRQPFIQAGRPDTDIATGQYDYAIITHPNFAAGLQPLVAAREAEGYTIKVVDVRDIYAQYSHGIFDAQAIRDYLTDAITQMGVEYVLLVGGDTRDYRGYGENSGISFLPSLYTQTYRTTQHGAADPLYVDADGDLLPDAAIGRFPVRTTAELATVIQKTLAYSNQNRTAIFTADNYDGISYADLSDGFAASLPSTWQSAYAYLDNLATADAKTKLIETINGGVGLVNYFGHSNPDRWTFDGLFATTDIAQLTNTEVPSAVLQYGCWSSYYIHPDYDSMSEALLLADSGAAIVLGATNLTTVSSDVVLGNRLSPLLVTPNKTVGEAILEAKQALGNGANLKDVTLGWILFGDPTLVLDPN